MRRRSFVQSAAAVAGASMVAKSGQAAATDPQTKPVRAADIRDYLLKQGPWVNPKDTVDTFKAGDPETVVKKIAVAWMPYL